MSRDTRGKKPVKSAPARTFYRKALKALEFFEDYLLDTSLLELFTKGKMRSKVLLGRVALDYVPADTKLSYTLRLPIRPKTQREFEELLEVVQNFLLDLYYTYEFDGEPMTLRRLGILLGVSRQAVHHEVKMIFKKISEKRKAHSYLQASFEEK